MGAFTPKPFPGDAEQIEKAAVRLRQTMLQKQGRTSPPRGDDVREFLDVAVAKLRGRIAVSHSPSWTETDGGSLLIAAGAKSFIIRLSPLTSPLRDNFTIAHELGHYLLHYPHETPVAEPVVFNRYGSDLVELQANRFAAAFLMPKDEFAQARRELRDDEYRLAAHFGVSRPAAAVRKNFVTSA